MCQRETLHDRLAQKTEIFAINQLSDQTLNFLTSIQNLNLENISAIQKLDVCKKSIVMAGKLIQLKSGKIYNPHAPRISSAIDLSHHLLIGDADGKVIGVKQALQSHYSQFY